MSIWLFLCWKGNLLAEIRIMRNSLHIGMGFQCCTFSSLPTRQTHSRVGRRGSGQQLRCTSTWNDMGGLMTTKMVSFFKNHIGFYSCVYVGVHRLYVACVEVRGACRNQFSIKQVFGVELRTSDLVASVLTHCELTCQATSLFLVLWCPRAPSASALC